MLPSYLEEERKNCRMTPDAYHQAHKIIHFSILLMKFVSINLYFNLIQQDNSKIKNIKKFLCDNFSRPTEGQWANFFEQLINADAKYKKAFKTKISNENNELLNKLCYTFISTEIKSNQNNITDFFQRIIKIKNSFVSHGMLKEEDAELFVKNIKSILDEIIIDIDDYINPELFMTINSTKACEIISYENNIFDPSDYNTEEVTNDGLYLAVNKKLFYVWPFLTCRDGKILVYDSFDKTHHRVNFNKGTDKTYINTDKETLPELFNIDYNYLNSKPLNIKVFCKNGVSHNLPTADFDKFIGRKNEIAELQKALNHKRHFITALDGIGGVGKTAIAIHCCEELLEKNQDVPFEYIVWLSAKNTKLQNGKIIQLEQSFEHLGQLLDTILIVLGFNEYINIDNLKEKEKIVYELLDETKILLVLDNLETIKPDKLEAIWDFINEIPDPSKVLLTSREFPQSVPQTIRIENLSEEDSYQLINQFASEIGISDSYLQGIKNTVYKLSSGLPIVIKSILGQIKLSKNINIIQKEIENNTDNISKFCFEQQLRMLDKEHKIVILAICLSTDILNHDALQLVVGDLITNSLVDIVQNLRNFSIIKINTTVEQTEYSILPIIKNYALNYFKDNELASEIQKKLNDYYELKEVDNYALLPVEAECISCEALIPRKIVDKAMNYAQSGEFEQADSLFKKATKEYSLESYTWYMYSQFLAQYQGFYKEAINALKQAASLEQNYIYQKKMGDYYLKLANYQKSIQSYKEAYEIAKEEKNKSEMLYCLSNAQFNYVKVLRKRIKNNCFDNTPIKQERNLLYKEIIDNLEKYVTTQPHIYDGKKEKIYRHLSESYFGLKDYNKAIETINKAVEISNNDSYQTEYRTFIFQYMSERHIQD